MDASYCCPKCKSKFSLDVKKKKKTNVIEGTLLCTFCSSIFPIKDDVPEFSDLKELSRSELETLREYERSFKTYDNNIEFFFKTLHEDESKIRNMLADMVVTSPSSKILEIGCGTGRDSIHIANRLNSEGKLYLQDISRKMLGKCRSVVTNCNISIEFAVTNGLALPFPDQFFDAVYHFGGLNNFSDIGLALKEITRVTRIGGKIVVGDEGIPPWLRNTQYAKYLMNSNPLFEKNVPLENIPETARNVSLKWIVGGVFYIIEYNVGKEEPPLEVDINFPGFRGGTHRTRYFGKLEGVKPETKKKALRAIKKSRKSIHKWVDEVIDKAATKELKRDYH